MSIVLLYGQTNKMVITFYQSYDNPKVNLKDNYNSFCIPKNKNEEKKRAVNSFEDPGYEIAYD